MAVKAGAFRRKAVSPQGGLSLQFGPDCTLSSIVTFTEIAVRREVLLGRQHLLKSATTAAAEAVSLARLRNGSLRN